MVAQWLDTVPVLSDFSDVLKTSGYAALPNHWVVGVSDIVNSTGAIEAGRYKEVNLVGAGVIAAVSNALQKRMPLYVFGGDGARFAVPPENAALAADALSRVAMWAGRDLGLNLRVGMIGIPEIRAAGFDVRAAFWQASENVRHAVFAGGGLEYAETQLKKGSIAIAPAPADNEPDLDGLSCQWGPIEPTHGKIVSLIVKPVDQPPEADFANVSSKLLKVIHETSSINPVPPAGPQVRWPGKAINLQALIPRNGYSTSGRYALAVFKASISWLVFKFGMRIGKFEPQRYRREISVNSDFRKFDDGLIMTIDCSPETIERLREILDRASREDVLRYGMYIQEQALLTCIAPAVTESDHIHFVDGAGGGYVAAARQLQQSTLN